MPSATSRFWHRPACRAAILSVLLLAVNRFVHAQAPDFTLPGLGDRPVRLADYRGRWVVVNFWASWCSPCLLEMPELQAFHEAHRDRVAVVGVNFEDRPASEIRAFVSRLAITFPVALSGGNPIPGFALKGVPTTFLVSPAGTLADTHLGTVNAAMLAERLAELEKADAAAR